jgi:hypothetical protein
MDFGAAGPIPIAVERVHSSTCLPKALIPISLFCLAENSFVMLGRFMQRVIAAFEIPKAVKNERR